MVIQAQSMQGVVASLSIPAWILIPTVPAVAIGVFGYRWIFLVRVVRYLAAEAGIRQFLDIAGRRGLMRSRRWAAA